MLRLLSFALSPESQEAVIKSDCHGGEVRRSEKAPRHGVQQRRRWFYSSNVFISPVHVRQKSKKWSICQPPGSTLSCRKRSDYLFKVLTEILEDYIVN